MSAATGSPFAERKPTLSGGASSMDRALEWLGERLNPILKYLFAYDVRHQSSHYLVLAKLTLIAKRSIRQNISIRSVDCCHERR